jgi:hypothetical protein
MENTLLTAFVAIILIWLLRRRSEKRLEPPRQEAAQQRPGFVFDTPDGQDWSAQAHGVTYEACLYSEETATIEVATPEKLAAPLEVNAREKTPDLGNDPRKGEVKALLDLGVDYIDIGFNTDRVAAELPCRRFASERVETLEGRNVRRVVISKELAAKIVGHLLRLRDMSREKPRG